MTLDRSSAWGNAGGLDPAHFPGQQHTDEEDNGKADPESQRSGHVPFFGCLALHGRGAASHHVHQGRAQTDQNGEKRDGNEDFHGHIIQ